MEPDRIWLDTQYTTSSFGKSLGVSPESFRCRIEAGNTTQTLLRTNQFRTVVTLNRDPDKALRTLKDIDRTCVISSKAFDLKKAQFIIQINPSNLIGLQVHKPCVSYLIKLDIDWSTSCRLNTIMIKVGSDGSSSREFKTTLISCRGIHPTEHIGGSPGVPKPALGVDGKTMRPDNTLDLRIIESNVIGSQNRTITLAKFNNLIKILQSYIPTTFFTKPNSMRVRPLWKLK